jgi:hypothetical protein
MLTIYLNTTEDLFLDAAGNDYPEGSPSLTVGGKEEIRFFLKSTTPDWGTAAARPAEWPADTSWATIPGISAMLTVDNDYRKYLQGKLISEATEGSVAISANVSEVDEIPESGILKILPGNGKEEYLFFDSRQASGSNITFNLGSDLSATFPQGTTVQVQQEPLAQAFIEPEQSNWSNGELAFTMVSDSLRLRREVESGNSAKVNITGIELLLYSTATDGTVQIHRAFLLDTATLKNVQGNPGFPAEVPDKFEDEIAKNVAEKAEELKAEILPEIGTNGNWVIDGIDTGVKAQGPAGPQGSAAGFGTPVLNVTTGEPGTAASGTVTATGDNTAKVFTLNLTIPEGMPGEQGPKGDPMKIDATGTTAELAQYDAETKGFAFLATDTGKVYIKNSDTSGDWSAPVGFQGPSGKDGEDGYTPVRGTDYWTEEDIATIKGYVDDAILNGAW